MQELYNLQYNWGVDCDNEDVMLDENYFLTIVNGEIFTSICPSGYCCQKDSCHYIYDKESLCAPNRNYKSLLCGSCIDGYSETMNTNTCKKCDQSHFEYLFLPFLFSIIMSLFL